MYSAFHQYQRVRIFVLLHCSFKTAIWSICPRIDRERNARSFKLCRHGLTNEVRDRRTKDGLTNGRTRPLVQNRQIAFKNTHLFEFCPFAEMFESYPHFRDFLDFFLLLAFWKFQLSFLLLLVFLLFNFFFKDFVQHVYRYFVQYFFFRLDVEKQRNKKRKSFKMHFHHKKRIASTVQLTLTTATSLPPLASSPPLHKEVGGWT